MTLKIRREANGKLVSECHSDLVDDCSFKDTQAYTLKDQMVVIEFSNFDSCRPYLPWIGSHKNVHYWVVTDCRHAIGFNENPATGWSFPVVKLGLKRYKALLAEYGQLPLITE